jgi:tRNA (cmo5U34)-methyltransferase
MTKDWNFNNDWIVENFDSHVREQLPWYDFATNTVTSIVKNYLRPNGIVYDIGASTGNIGRAISGVIESRNARLIAIEESKEIAEKYVGGGELIVSDASVVEYEKFSVAICFLSLMFIPQVNRIDLIKRLKDSLEVGGCIIVVDKDLPPSGYVGSVFRRITMEWKLIGGANHENIIKKELSLSGIQRPISVSELGDNAVEFFRIGEFAGWIIEK